MSLVRHFITSIDLIIQPVFKRMDVVVLTLIVVILMLPKFQLIPIAGTYVNIRFEDFLVAGVYGIWLIGVFSGRYKPFQVIKSKSLLTFIIYGFFITLLGILIFETIDAPHLGILHWARHLEYMLMYVVAATTLNPKALKQYIYVILIVGILTWVYGFLQWQDILPSVHTLSKSGELGTYSEIGYVISTFAAHYDFGAFLMICVIFSIWGYFTHKGWDRVWFVVLALLFWWMSRLVYGRAAYLGLLGTAIFMLGVKISPLVLAPIYELVMTFLRYFSGQFSIYSYKFTLAVLPEPKEPSSIVSKPTPTPKPATSGVDEVVTQFVPQQLSWLDEQIMKIAPAIQNIFNRLDINLDPSANIRLRIWREKIEHVGYNIYWGGGYYAGGLGADGNYVRMLVEVGVLGMAWFLLILRDFITLAWKLYRSHASEYEKMFGLSIVALIIGMLINAVFIDIFSASKIAFLFWFLMGLFAAVHRSQSTTT